jgi:Fe-S cluster biogenesis protein NfuA
MLEPAMLLKIAAVLKAIRPAVQADGGDFELVEVTPELEVRIRFLAACVTCPSSPVTLKSGIERNLKAYVPQVRGVVAVP